MHQLYQRNGHGRQALDESLPPHCPEAERGVLGCCLIKVSKVAEALEFGVSPRWFYAARHGGSGVFAGPG